MSLLSGLIIKFLAVACSENQRNRYAASSPTTPTPAAPTTPKTLPSPLTPEAPQQLPLYHTEPECVIYWEEPEACDTSWLGTFVKYPRAERIDGHLVYKAYILIEGEKEWKTWPICPHHFNVESGTDVHSDEIM